MLIKCKITITIVANDLAQLHNGPCNSFVSLMHSMFSMKNSSVKSVFRSFGKNLLEGNLAI